MVSPCKTVTALVEAVSRNRFGAAVSWRIATSSGSLAGSLGLISVNIRSYPRQQGAVPVFPEPLTHSMLGSVWGKKKKKDFVLQIWGLCALAADRSFWSQRSRPRGRQPLWHLLQLLGSPSHPGSSGGLAADFSADLLEARRQLVDRVTGLSGGGDPVNQESYIRHSCSSNVGEKLRHKQKLRVFVLQEIMLKGTPPQGGMGGQTASQGQVRKERPQEKQRHGQW